MPNERELSKVRKQNLRGYGQNQSWSLTVCQQTPELLTFQSYHCKKFSSMDMPKLIITACYIHLQPSLPPLSYCEINLVAISCIPEYAWYAHQKPPSPKKALIWCYWQLLALLQLTAFCTAPYREKENTEQTQFCSSYTSSSPCSKDQFCSFLLNVH